MVNNDSDQKYIMEMLLELKKESENRISTLESSVKHNTGEMREMKKEIKEIREDVQSQREDQIGVKAMFEQLKTGFSGLVKTINEKEKARDRKEEDRRRKEIKKQRDHRWVYSTAIVTLLSLPKIIEIIADIVRALSS